MQIPRDMVIQLIMQKFGQGKADQAGTELPDQVDTDKDAGLLGKFGINPQELLGGGSGGGLAGRLGL